MLNKKNFHYYYLLLIPALFLAKDFLPNEFIFLNTISLLVVCFLRPPGFLAPLYFISIYPIFKIVGMKIIPETMVPILATCIMARFLQNKSKNEIEIYPFFLWIGIFAVFSASFNYLLYALASILTFFLFQNKDRKLNIKQIFKNIWKNKKQLGFAAVLTTTLFVFFPRFSNFLPSANSVAQGKIGYTKTVNNSTTSNLQLSSQTAFFAELNKELSPQNLYWRGRVHAQTDGYNWTPGKFNPREKVKRKFNKQIIYKLKYEQNFEGDIIALDSPIQILDSNISSYKIHPTNEYRTYTLNKKVTLTALSTLEDRTEYNPNKENIIQYLQTPRFTPKAVQDFIDQIKNGSASAVIGSFKQALIRGNFAYSLTPGEMPTMTRFLQNKRGYCTHFASLLGIVLRKNGIPSRLVTGFQGGTYNEIGKYYEIKSNDAHAWVEYLDENKWKRVDPTSFVSPERILLGGNQFLSGEQVQVTNANKSFFSRNATKIQQYWNNLNYQVSLFIDNFDRTTQTRLANLLNVKLKIFFTIGFLVIGIILSIHYLGKRVRLKRTFHPADSALRSLDKKLRKKKIRFHKLKTIQAMRSQTTDPQLTEIIQAYQLARYSKDPVALDNLKELIKKV